MLEERFLGFRRKGSGLAQILDLDKVAEMTDGFSGADITAIVNTAVSLVLQEYLATYPKPEDAKHHVAEATVTMKHFEDAIRKVKTSREGKPAERLAVSYYR